ncbi:MAG: hypothetical protein QM765_26490 [Myxococcales bacterium]
MSSMTRRSRGVAWAVAAVLLAVGPSARAAEPPNKRIAVLDIKVVGNVDAKTVAGLSSYIASEASRLGLRVIAGSDIAAVIGFAKQRELLACSDSSCLVELGGGLGVDYLLSSEVSEVAGVWLLSLALLDVRGGRSMNRLTKRSNEPRGLVDAVPEAVEGLLEPRAANASAAAAPKATEEPGGAGPAKAGEREKDASPGVAAPSKQPASAQTQAASDATLVERTDSRAAAAGQAAEPRTPEPPGPAKARPLRPIGIALGVAGALVAGAGAVFHGYSLSSWEHYRELKAQGNADSAAAAKANSDDRMLIAEVLYGVGGAALVTGIVLVVVGGGDRTPVPAVALRLLPGGGAVTVSGTF